MELKICNGFCNAEIYSSYKKDSYGEIIGEYMMCKKCHGVIDYHGE